MAATTPPAPTFRTVQGWTIPLECPTAKVLASWGTPKLQAAATLHPLAAQVLAEKQAVTAKREAEAAEREVKRAAKGSAKAKFTPSTGNEPGAVDTAATRPVQTQAAPVQPTALAQVIAALVAIPTTLAEVNAVADAVGEALDALADRLEAQEEAAKAKAKAAPKATPAPAPKPAVAAQQPAAMAAKATDAPKPVVQRSHVGTTPEDRAALRGETPATPAPKVGELTAEQKAAEQKERDTLTAAYKAAKLPGYGTCQKWKLDTLRAKLDAYNAAPKAEAKPVAPAKVKANAPAVPAKGTVLIADGKGGYTVATAEQLMAALESMTAPAVKNAA